MKLTLEELKRIELAIRVETPSDKKDGILLTEISKKINAEIDKRELKIFKNPKLGSKEGVK